MFERVGGSRPVEVEVRIVGATNADLPALARAGRFKQDLLDRLSFEVLTLPPLREREGDALLLAEHFAARMAGELGRSEPPRFSDEARERIAAHAWPGNVRQLKNVVERAVYRAEGALIAELDLDPFVSPFAPAGEGAAQAAPSPSSPQPRDFKRAVAAYERGLIKQALEQARFNQRQAASALGLTYHQLRGLLKKHGGVDSL